MATELKYYFGIDFGTTRSATVGYIVMDQNPECIQYGDEEGRPIPSVVAIDKTTGDVFTGRAAWDKKMQLSESCEYISSIKTILDSGKTKVIAGHEWTAVNAASEVIKHLKTNVRERTGIEMEEATVAIPVGFNASKREKLREAAMMAGVNIRSFISEPTAAFFANYNKLKSSSLVAVFDWGGGTLDVSILQHINGKVSELATIGQDVAGDYIDDKIAKRIHTKIARKKGVEISFEDMPSSAQDLMRVRAERAKRMLGDDDTATISINNYGVYGACRETLEYDWFADIVNPEVEMAMTCLQEAINQSGVGLANIDRIVMVGGSSNLRPLLIRQLALECGYSGASIKERLYSTYPDSDIKMAGILLYTSSSDSDGSLGGLVRKGLPESFEFIFRNMLQEASWCSSDPICIGSRAQGYDSLNYAACHACALLPETSCEMRNCLLDRTTIVGTLESREQGFFGTLLK